ncbi:alpha/beta hydrolase [Flavobacterium sp. BFFFF1]|uniref:alpha/beta hydrolase n=1 Tax=Flavobacterium sp. BFFFF1 TaxID=2015557 RepID=UPI0034464E46
MMMRNKIMLLACTLMVVVSGCATKKYKNVPYLSAAAATAPKLNVFAKRGHPTRMPVLIFVHGGNWNTGNKNQYGFFGRHFAQRGVLCIIPDYTLSPDVNYDVMATQVAQSILWAKAHAAEYGGDPNQIYITGHSAGGHLAALAVVNPKYGIKPGVVSGIILNDAAGLDMQSYLEQQPPTEAADYLTTWTNEPEQWHNASPIYFLDKDSPRFMIYVGSKTYPSIAEGNDRFLKALHAFQPKVAPVVLQKKHIPMILQYFWPWSRRYGEVIAFIKQ